MGDALPSLSDGMFRVTIAGHNFEVTIQSDGDGSQFAPVQELGTLIGEAIMYSDRSIQRGAMVVSHVIDTIRERLGPDREDETSRPTLPPTYAAALDAEIRLIEAADDVVRLWREHYGKKR